MQFSQLLSSVLFPLAQAQAVFKSQKCGFRYSRTNPSIPLNISDLYNNRGFSMKPNDSSLDGYGSGYPAQSLPPSKFLYNGINFAFPEYKTSENDNVLALGQTIEVPRGRYFSVQMLASSVGRRIYQRNLQRQHDILLSILVPAW
jgi:alpha-L-fucosidase